MARKERWQFKKHDLALFVGGGWSDGVRNDSEGVSIFLSARTFRGKRVVIRDDGAMAGMIKHYDIVKSALSEVAEAYRATGESRPDDVFKGLELI